MMLALGTTAPARAAAGYVLFIHQHVRPRREKVPHAAVTLLPKDGHALPSQTRPILDFLLAPGRITYER
jgi:hypothetical protein